MPQKICASTRLVRLSLLAGLTLPAGWAAADTVWVGSAHRKPIPYDNVKVTKVEGDTVTFTTMSGRETSKPLDQIQLIKLDDEPALGPAEEAFLKSDWPTTIDAYRKASQASNKDWVKLRASMRIIEASEKSGNFPAAVAGFIELLPKNPALANQKKPAIPKNKPDAIDAAIITVQQAAQFASLKTEQKVVLLNYLAALQGAKGDTAGASATLQELRKLAPSDLSDPSNRKLEADVTLTEARNAFSQKQYAKVVQSLTAGGALFTEPQQQSDALFLIAESKAATAQNNPEQLKDAALAYMRVAANFKGVEGAPHVGDSLLKTAALEEKLKNPQEALVLYRQVANEYKGTPAAQQAQQEADRLAALAKDAKG